MTAFDENIQHFQEVINWAQCVDLQRLKEFLSEEDQLPRIFVASGGSYSAAAYAEMLTVNAGRMAHAMTPLVYKTGCFCDLPAKTIILSASGASKDCLRTFEKACMKQTVGAITLTSVGRLQKNFPARKIDSLYAFDIPTGRDGFLATNSILAFYLLLYRAFGCEKTENLTTNLTEDELSTFSDFAQKVSAGITNIVILYSGRTYSVALDMESKLIEGAIVGVQLTDYRNFAHGRFNWLTYYPQQTSVICLLTPDDITLCERIVHLLPKEIPVLKITSHHIASSLAPIDLLIKEHFLCDLLGEAKGLNLNHPPVPDYGKKIYTM